MKGCPDGWGNRRVGPRLAILFSIIFAAGTSAAVSAQEPQRIRGQAVTNGIGRVGQVNPPKALTHRQRQSRGAVAERDLTNPKSHVSGDSGPDAFLAGAQVRMNCLQSRIKDCPTPRQ